MFLTCFWSVLSILPLSLSKEIETTQESILDSLLDRSRRYDQRIRPYPPNDGPTMVAVDMYVRHISSIDEIAMEYTLDLLVRQSWVDPRMQYAIPNITKGFSYLKTNERVLKHIWVPDLFFANEKKAFFHTVSVPNVMLRIYPNGEILYSTRFSLVLSCDMDLKDYPFDTQHCKMQLGSFSYTEDSLIFYWKTAGEPITVSKALQLPKFNMTGRRTLECRNEHYTGNFSCLRAEFSFNRELGYHLVQAYLPCILLVIASWIGFWLDADAVPARVTLGVTTLLTTTAQGANIIHTLPPVSYTKAIDVWIGACTSFVFLALLEFAFVNYLGRRSRSRRQRRDIYNNEDQATHGCLRTSLIKLHHQNSSYVMHPEGFPRPNVTYPKTFDYKSYMSECPDCGESLLPVTVHNRNKAKRYKSCCPNFWSSCRAVECRSMHNAKTVDKMSRFLFPLAFCLFTLCYCFMYPVWGKRIDNERNYD